MVLTTHLHLVPRLMKSVELAIPLLPPLFLHDILQAELHLFHFYHYVYVFTDGGKKKKVAKNCDTPAVLMNDLMYVIF